MEENKIVYPPELIEELKGHLGPVGKGTPEFIEQMQEFANKLAGTTPTINNYYCQQGHKTVTRDRDGPSNQLFIPCPVCSREARSVLYMCDQSEMPTHEFYKPKHRRGFKKSQQQALLNGAMHFKNIWNKEPQPPVSKKTKVKITQ